MHNGAAQLKAAERRLAVSIPCGDVHLPGELAIPADAVGCVIFAHGAGSSRLSPRNRHVASELRARRLATLLFDLLTTDEAEDRRNVFDVALLADRLQQATRWAQAREDLATLPAALFGASTGAAAALVVAARETLVGAVVSRGGRPDLAMDHLAFVTAPTLLIVGEEDEEVLELNRMARAAMRCASELRVIPGATHLFEEPGALDTVARLAGDWFLRWLPAEDVP